MASMVSKHAWKGQDRRRREDNIKNVSARDRLLGHALDLTGSCDYKF
jgi:hypothetical protein